MPLENFIIYKANLFHIYDKLYIKALPFLQDFLDKLSIISYDVVINFKTGDDVITKEKVEDALNKVRVGLKAEGGDIELIEIKDDTVYVRLTGACGTCPMSTLTLKNWVTTTMKKEIPEVKAVQAV